MIVSTAPLWSTLLSLAAIFLGLSLIIQILQEMYKFITSNLSRTFRKTLEDFLGPWFRQMNSQDFFHELSIQGPFTLWRQQPHGKLLPLGKSDLEKMLQKTLPFWYQKGFKILSAEAERSADKPDAPSELFLDFLNNIASAQRGSSGYWNAIEIQEFLNKYGYEFQKGKYQRVKSNEVLDFKTMLTDYKDRFLRHLASVEEHYDQLINNFNYVYRRRNLRLSFILGLLLAIVLKLPFQNLYTQAANLSCNEASQLQENMLEIYEQLYKNTESADSTIILSEQLKTMDKISKQIGMVLQEEKWQYSILDKSYIDELSNQGWTAIIEYLIGCIITAIMISFGAPFWNDLMGSLSRMKSPVKRLS